MGLDVVDELGADAANRVNHIAAVLENHRHFAAIHLPPLLRRVLQYILTIKGNGACTHAASTGQAAHNSADDGGFTTAGLAYNGHYLALI